MQKRLFRLKEIHPQLDTADNPSSTEIVPQTHLQIPYESRQATRQVCTKESSAITIIATIVTLVIIVS